ncbi:MAG: alpha/beta hydrolase [Sciscionella sp.]
MAARAARTLAGIVLLATTVAGCGGANRQAQTSARAPAPPTPSFIADGCIPAGAGTAVKIPADEHTIPAVVYGHGTRGIVLSNQSDRDLCQWKAFAPRLAKAGYQVITWDYGADTPENELAVVASTLRTRGASELVLIGASKGAKATLVAAAGIPAVAGVISLSGEAVEADGTVVADHVAKLTAPVLFITAKQDPYGAASAAKRFMAVSPSKHKRLVTVAGQDHGVDLLTGSHGKRVTGLITRFLAQQLGG